MIVYKDILGKLKEAGYTTTELREQKILSSSVIQYIREGKPITTETVNKICNILECQPNDLMIWYDDEDGGCSFPDNSIIQYIIENVVDAREEIDKYIKNVKSLERSARNPANQNRSYNEQLNTLYRKMQITLNRLETAEKYLRKLELEQPDPADIISKFWD